MIAVLHHGPVVGGEDDYGVFHQTFLLKVGKHLTYAPVGLENHVSTCPQTRFSRESFVGTARHVRLVKAIVEKEWLSVLECVEPVAAFVEEVLSHLFVHPSGRLSSLHISYSRHPVHYAHIVAVMPVHTQHFRVFERRCLSRERMVVADFYRVVRVQVLDQTVLHVNCRHPVVRGSHDASVVEAHVVGARRELTVPVRIPVTHSEMPLPHRCGRISRLPEHFRHSRLLTFDDKRRVARQYHRIRIAEGIHTRKEAVAAGCRGRGGRVAVFEEYAVPRNRVYVRSRYAFAAIGADVPLSEVVGNDKQHVRPGRIVALRLYFAVFRNCRKRKRQ